MVNIPLSPRGSIQPSSSLGDRTTGSFFIGFIRFNIIRALGDVGRKGLGMLSATLVVSCFPHGLNLGVCYAAF